MELRKYYSDLFKTENRFNFLFTYSVAPIFSCENCGKESCKGLRGKCKQFGAYSLALTLK
jgi:hypothetical protein